MILFLWISQCTLFQHWCLIVRRVKIWSTRSKLSFKVLFQYEYFFFFRQPCQYDWIRGITVGVIFMEERIQLIPDLYDWGKSATIDLTRSKVSTPSFSLASSCWQAPQMCAYVILDGFLSLKCHSIWKDWLRNEIFRASWEWNPSQKWLPNFLGVQTGQPSFLAGKVCIAISCI